jgi:hypothetical protein
MTEARIVPRTFDELTVEQAREILERVPNQKLEITWLLNDENLVERPDSFAFKTREGTVGLLQFEPAQREVGNLTIRYKLEQRN